MNSLFALLGFLTFAALGYFSFVRLMFKQELSQQSEERFNPIDVVKRSGAPGMLAESLIFVSLPGFALLLFWGWGPAMLWVVIAHLLIETTANFITAKMHRQVSLVGHFSDFDSINSSLRATLFQILLLSLVAVLVVLLARLIDDQTGLLFAIVCTVAAVQILRSASGALDAVFRLISALALLTLGLLLARSVGIAVFGELVLAPSLAPWLKINNQSLLILLLLFSGFQLARSESAKSGLSMISGSMMLLALAILIAQIGILQPELDAPMLAPSKSAEQPPLFALTFLVASPTLLLVLWQIVVPIGSNSEAETPLVTTFWSRQIISIVTLALSLVLLVSLATASGIGAWNTHFTDWTTSATLDAMFDLIGRSFASLSGFAALSDQSLNTLLTVTICLFGLSCLVFCGSLIARQCQLALDEAEEENSKWARVLASEAPQYLVVFVFSTWLLSTGLSILFWIWVVSLAWVLCSDVLCDYARDMETAALSDHLRRGFALGIFALGAVQLSWTGIMLFVDGQLLFSCLISLNVIIGVLVCGSNARSCWRGLQLRDEAKLFEG